MARQIRYLQALNEAITQEMRRDPRTFVIGEDIRANMRGEMKGLFDEFGPERVLNTPISEAAFTGFATGAAMAGRRPIVEFQVSSFLYVSFDQLANQAAKLRYMLGGQVNIPVTYLVMAAGARRGTAGQHSDNPYVFLVHAGVKVVCPSTPYDMKGLATAAIREDDPVAVFAPAAALANRGEVPEEPYLIDLGQGEVKREGTDVTIVAIGHLVSDALGAAEELASEGISVQVWDPRTLLPLDITGLCDSVIKTGRVVVFDDSNRTCGFGAHLASIVAEKCFSELRAPIRIIGRADVPIPFSGPLESAVLPQRQKLLETVRAIRAIDRVAAFGTAIH